MLSRSHRSGGNSCLAGVPCRTEQAGAVVGGPKSACVLSLARAWSVASCLRRAVLSLASSEFQASARPQAFLPPDGPVLPHPTGEPELWPAGLPLPHPPQRRWAVFQGRIFFLQLYPPGALPLRPPAGAEKLILSILWPGLRPCSASSMLPLRGPSAESARSSAGRSALSRPLMSARADS